jgi:aminoglycoside N3'-acetyltransferase
MKQLDIIQRTKGLPATRETILAELRELGLRPGMILILHDR